jgi:hypothetical protein
MKADWLSERLSAQIVVRDGASVDWSKHLGCSVNTVYCSSGHDQEPSGGDLMV